ncbi:MAG TPA: biotin/lipoate A/B protein ligase family protein [Paludibacter sp.]|nr:biotin/lipoate A/B protein ligase family protein [Paludibacter sp.]
MILIFSHSRLPAFNLAAEEYLFSGHQDEIMFVYVNEPSVIIGCNQAIRNEVDTTFCRDNNIVVVRRMSGGGAVYHDRGNLNFCLIHNNTTGKFALDDAFLKPVTEVLEKMEVPVTVGKRKDLWLQNEYKVSGTASHFSKDRVLQHGTLLYDTRLDLLEHALASPDADENVRAIPSVRSRVKNLRGWFEEQGLVTMDSEVFFETFVNRLCSYYGLDKAMGFDEKEIKAITELAKQKYSSESWTNKK